MAHLSRPPSRPRPTIDEGIRHTAHLRGLNLERVLAVVMDRQEPFTRAELIDATGLSAPTVGSLAAALIRSGVVRDLGAGPSRGGRRPAFMEFNAHHAFVAGIDLGPTHTRLAVADLRGEVLAHRVLPTPPNHEPNAMLDEIATALRALMKEAQIPAARLFTVAAGVPGAVDLHTGIAAHAPNLKGWSEVPVGAILTRALGVPVVVENDVNLAILGERWRGVAGGHDNCAFIAVGTGIGAGIVVHGELHHGHHFLAGEIGYMCMGAEYVDADLRARGGGLEMLAGLKALTAQWAGPANVDHDGWVGALFAAAAAGDEQARRAVQQSATMIGIAIANLSVVMDPSLIVLGGALVTQGPRLIDDVRAIVERVVPRASPIVSSSLGQEAPLWGAVLVATTRARDRMREQLHDAKARAAAIPAATAPATAAR
jgi:glucokinase